jgi:glycosyltransferase involved in cell wall biosynthesis
VRFVVTGSPDPAFPIREQLPPNVSCPGFVPRAELRALYARAQVYLQLSDHEGFGVAVAEALAMGAVPVVADLPALREVAGTAGRYVSRAATADDVAAAIVDALHASPGAGAVEWTRIDAAFGPAVRRAAWERLLEDHLTARRD